MSNEVLGSPPETERSRELWMQHGLGHILFRDVRGYALNEVPSEISDEAQAIAKKAIDDALYGVMMVLDGVTGSLRNDQFSLALRTRIELTNLATGNVEAVVADDQFDGCCMGFHSWKEGDFGDVPIVASAP